MFAATLHCDENDVESLETLMQVAVKKPKHDLNQQSAGDVHSRVTIVNSISLAYLVKSFKCAAPLTTLIITDL